jgi:hypothetical protein
VPSQVNAKYDHVHYPPTRGRVESPTFNALFKGEIRDLWFGLRKVIGWGRDINDYVRRLAAEVHAIRYRLTSVGFGEMYIEDETTWTPGLSVAYTKLTQGWEGGVIHGGVEFDTTNSQMTIADDAHYLVQLYMSGEGANNTTYNFAVFKNGVKTHATFDRSFGATATVGAGACAAIIEAEKRDVIDVRISVTAGAGTSFLATQAMLIVQHLADYGNETDH